MIKWLITGWMKAHSAASNVDSTVFTLAGSVTGSVICFELDETKLKVNENEIALITNLSVNEMQENDRWFLFFASRFTRIGKKNIWQL